MEHDRLCDTCKLFTPPCQLFSAKERTEAGGDCGGAYYEPDEHHPQHLRPCVVAGRYAYFHRWTTTAYVVEPSIMVGGTPGGQVQYTFGLVEYVGGKVAEVPSHKIRFTDWAKKEACNE